MLNDSLTRILRAFARNLQALTANKKEAIKLATISPNASHMKLVHSLLPNCRNEGNKKISHIHLVQHSYKCDYIQPCNSLCSSTQIFGQPIKDNCELTTHIGWYINTQKINSFPCHPVQFYNPQEKISSIVIWRMITDRLTITKINQSIYIVGHFFTATTLRP